MSREVRIRFNGRSRALRGRVVAELIEELGYSPAPRGIAVAVNGEVVRHGDWTTRRLDDGDDVEIVGAVQGG